MERILTLNRKEYTLIFDDINSWIMQANLCVSMDQNGIPRVIVVDKYKRRSLARVISGLKKTGTKNGNTLDLRLENLTEPNYSRVPVGVTGERYIQYRDGSYHVVIWHRSKSVYIGADKDIENAKKIRDRAIKKLTSRNTKTI